MLFGKEVDPRSIGGLAKGFRESRDSKIPREKPHERNPTEYGKWRSGQGVFEVCLTNDRIALSNRGRDHADWD
jgi:hypothetical protein